MFFYIHGYEVTYVEYKVLQLHNFLKTHQTASKLSTRLFLRKINKNTIEVLTSRPF